MDLDGSETISRQEFVNVGLLANVKELFAKYDVNKNESLSPAELEAMLTRDLGYSADEAKEVFKLADVNGDGNVGEMEFYQAILLTIAAPKESRLEERESVFNELGTPIISQTKKGNGCR